MVPGARVIAQALAPRQLVARKDASCTSQLSSLADSVPTPTGKLDSWVQTVPGGIIGTTIGDELTDLCHISTPTPPASLSSEYSEYQDEVSSWQNSATPVAQSLASKCGKEISVLAELLLYTDEAGCTSAMSAAIDLVQSITGGGKNAAGPRETGYVAAAAAAAAAVGAMAAM
jgi:hypothetical protein